MKKILYISDKSKTQLYILNTGNVDFSLIYGDEYILNISPKLLDLIDIDENKLINQEKLDDLVLALKKDNHPGSLINF